jgi:hypothetical protein
MSVNSHFAFIKDERAWKRWIQTVDGATSRDYAKSDTRPPLVIHINVPRPDEYPCWACARLQSYGYEEQAPEYLYRVNLEAMIARIDTHYPARPR